LGAADVKAPVATAEDVRKVLTGAQAGFGRSGSTAFPKLLFCFADKPWDQISQVPRSGENPACGERISARSAPGTPQVTAPTLVQPAVPQFGGRTGERVCRKEWCPRRDSNPRPQDSYHFDFRRRLRVRGLDCPFAIGRNALRRRPSSLYTFPKGFGAWLGIGVTLRSTLSPTLSGSVERFPDTTPS